MEPIRRIIQRLEQLAAFSESPDHLFRPFCSNSAASVNKLIEQWACEDQLSFRLDALANVRLRPSRHLPGRKCLVVASHLDSVIDAGRFDGPLGFLIGYEMLLYYNRNQADLPFNLEVIGFSDEEGVRFQTTYLGSSAVTGAFQNEWFDLEDQDGKTMRQALRRFGCEADHVKNCVIPEEDWLAYYEVHIEQGPVLQEKGLPVGLVSDIYGQIRVSFQLVGKAGHAGTVPMGMRQDALAGLGEFMTRLEAFASGHDGQLVATIGQCSVLPGASNVIPGLVKASIDIRSGNMNLLDQAASDIQRLLVEVANRRQLKADWNLMQRSTPVYCDARLNQILGAAIRERVNVIETLSSGAGHDGVAVSKIAPICMLFVRCRDGISHHPDEFVASEDITKALEVSISFLHKLGTHSYE